MPKVSVIMPAYNHAKFVGAAIESVLNQTYKDWELIVIDDHSTDATFDIAKSFDDKRIRSYRNDTNLGVQLTMKRCVELSDGAYITFLPSDDMFVSSKLEKQVPILDDDPTLGAVFSGTIPVDETGNILTKDHIYVRMFENIPTNADRFHWLRFFFLNGNCLCQTSALARYAFYDMYGGYDRRLTQLGDWDFWIKILLTNGIHIVQDKLTFFRVHSDEANMSGDRPETYARGIWETVEVLRNYTRLAPEAVAQVFSTPFELDEDDVPYIIASACLKVPSLPHNILGVQLLMKELADDTKAEYLAEKFGFTHKDFYNITGAIWLNRRIR